MRNLILLVTTTAVVSGLRETTPGFAVDYRTFCGSPICQDLPYREQSRTFRQTSPSGLHRQFREETFREYRPSTFQGHEETRNFQGFKDDTRIYKDDTRIYKDDTRIYKDDSSRDLFKDEPRTFVNDEARQFRDEVRIFKDEGTRGFREQEIRAPFRDERVYRDEARLIRDGPRTFRDERPSFRDETRTFRDEHRTFRDEPRTYRDGPVTSFREDGRNLFRDEIRTFDGPRQYREEQRPFRSDGPRPYREEATRFREDGRMFRDEATGSMRNEAAGTYRDEARPFREESRPFKDELLFTQESQTLAEAQHRFNKEQHRSSPTFNGHANYLKYGNHGLGFASIPSAILPLEDNSPRLSSGMMTSDMSTTAATKSPNFLESGNKVTSSSTVDTSSNTKSHVTVTLAPDIVGSTPSQSTSINTINGGHTVSQQRNNENLVVGGSTNPSSSSTVTISNSGDTSVTPKVHFTTGTGSMSSSTMGINDIESDSRGQQGHGPTANSLHASKQDINVLATPSSYFPSETSPEVPPEALLNYVFKYQMPDDTKTRYNYGNSLQHETFNRIQAVPMLQHHQTAKYTILPELKIPGVSSIRQQTNEGLLNYVSTAGIPKEVSYLTANSQPLTLNTGYSTENLPTVNFARNLINLDRDVQFSHHGANQHMIGLRSNQYPQLRQIAPNEYLNQLGHYGGLGQHSQQTNNVPFTQGGLQLQLGGFGGIDYSALTGNSGASRGTNSINLGLTETSRPAGESTFGKISYGEPVWRL